MPQTPAHRHNQPAPPTGRLTPPNAVRHNRPANRNGRHSDPASFQFRLAGTVYVPVDDTNPGSSADEVVRAPTDSQPRRRRNTGRPKTPPLVFDEAGTSSSGESVSSAVLNARRSAWTQARGQVIGSRFRPLEPVVIIDPSGAGDDFNGEADADDEGQGQGADEDDNESDDESGDEDEMALRDEQQIPEVEDDVVWEDEEQIADLVVSEVENGADLPQGDEEEEEEDDDDDDDEPDQAPEESKVDPESRGVGPRRVQACMDLVALRAAHADTDRTSEMIGRRNQGCLDLVALRKEWEEKQKEDTRDAVWMRGSRSRD